jgi:sugar lactone lactonase YvrE
VKAGTLIAILATLVLAAAAPATSAHRTAPAATPTLLAGGLAGGLGSTVGPDHKLYVAEPREGRIARVDPETGAVSTFASGLPKQLGAVGLGGVMDVEFVGQTAYALVTLVGHDVGGTDTVGIYRVDGPHTFTVVADIGAWAMAHPPATDFFVPSGVQYALERYRGGFLVTDGHHNRVLQVDQHGSISEFRAFGDIVPTGLAIRGDRVYMAEAGPIPHLPATGKIVSFDASSPVTEVAAGGPLMVDVELGRGGSLYGLAQGHWSDTDPGTPADPNTGELLLARGDGTFALVAAGLDRPTSLEVIGDDAYVVTLAGEVWKVADLPRGD